MQSRLPRLRHLLNAWRQHFMSIVRPCIPHFTSRSRYVDGLSQCCELLVQVVVLAMIAEVAADGPSSSRMM